MDFEKVTGLINRDMVANLSKSRPSCPKMTNLPNSHEIWNFSPLWDALGNISLPCDFLKICPNLCHPFLWWPIYAIAMKFETFLCWGSFVATFLYPVISSVHFCQSVYLKVWCRMSASVGCRKRENQVPLDDKSSGLRHSCSCLTQRAWSALYRPRRCSMT